MPPTIRKELDDLKEIVSIHLQESGAIRSDLAWLKKAFWTLAGAGITLNASILVAILTYLLKK